MKKQNNNSNECINVKQNTYELNGTVFNVRSIGKEENSPRIVDKLINVISGDLETKN